MACASSLWVAALANSSIPLGVNPPPAGVAGVTGGGEVGKTGACAGALARSQAGVLSLGVSQNL